MKDKIKRLQIMVYVTFVLWVLIGVLAFLIFFSYRDNANIDDLYVYVFLGLFFIVIGLIFFFNERFLFKLLKPYPDPKNLLYRKVMLGESVFIVLVFSVGLIFFLNAAISLLSSFFG